MDGAAGSTERDERQSVLLTRQQLFAVYLAKLILYANSRGYGLTLAEIGVQEQRRGRDGRIYSDGVHMEGSLHYDRLAADLNLFVDGRYIRDSHHWAWIDLGSYWEALDPALCVWGGHFKKPDGNHVSVKWGGRA